jgi:hypothetical protein
MYISTLLADPAAITLDLLVSEPNSITLMLLGMKVGGIEFFMR